MSFLRYFHSPSVRPTNVGGTVWCWVRRCATFFLCHWIRQSRDSRAGRSQTAAAVAASPVWGERPQPLTTPGCPVQPGSPPPPPCGRFAAGLRRAGSLLSLLLLFLLLLLLFFCLLGPPGLLCPSSAIFILRRCGPPMSGEPSGAGDAQPNQLTRQAFFVPNASPSVGVYTSRFSSVRLR